MQRLGVGEKRIGRAGDGGEHLAAGALRQLGIAQLLAGRPLGRHPLDHLAQRGRGIG